MMRYVLFAVLIGCCALANAADEISFTRDIVPLLKNRCVVCHLPDSGQADLALHPKGVYANLIGVKFTQSPLQRVEPGNAENSYLYRKLLGTQTAAAANACRSAKRRCATARNDTALDRNRCQARLAAVVIDGSSRLNKFVRTKQRKSLHAS